MEGARYNPTPISMVRLGNKLHTLLNGNECVSIDACLPLPTPQPRTAPKTNVALGITQPFIDQLPILDT